MFVSKLEEAERNARGHILSYDPMLLRSEKFFLTLTSLDSVSSFHVIPLPVNRKGREEEFDYILEKMPEVVQLHGVFSNAERRKLVQSGRIIYYNKYGESRQTTLKSTRQVQKILSFKIKE